MAAPRFGTDGIRGRAFDELSTDLAFAIGRAAASVLGGSEAVIGADTRESGPALRDAVAAGLIAGGVRPLDLGVAPTPAVAFIAAARGATGVMISASHNPWHDNGIKLFSSGGSKLSDDEQAAIEAALAQDASLQPGSATAPIELAVAIDSIQPELADWVANVVATSRHDLQGLKVVLDTANGAASHVVAPALVDLGVDLTVLFNTPDGRNINEACGSTHPGALGTAVVEHGADLGIALDGDADRLLCVDHGGRVIDGDHLMAIIAGDLRRRDALTDGVVVVTVMSNLGFHKAMEAAGITVNVTPVGDRHILEALSSNEWSFGGEQSGHLIFRDLAVTGDGFLSAVQLLNVLAATGQPLAELADQAMTSFPQVLRNVRVAERVADPTVAIAAEIAAAEATLGDAGRVLIRASGTEPLIRVMVEAATDADAERICDQLCDAVVAHFGA